MQYAEAGVIKSGTSTLESALFELPEVVCYKGGQLSFMIAKQLVDVKYISLVNLIMDKPIVKELIQSEMTAKNISTELKELLHNRPYREEMIRNYKELKTQLGGTGASERLARSVYNAIKN
jgi:lipid-A-disaccharide synthase